MGVVVSTVLQAEQVFLGLFYVLVQPRRVGVAHPLFLEHVQAVLHHFLLVKASVEEQVQVGRRV